MSLDLKPTSFGLSGTYRNIAAYKKALIEGIDDRISDFNAVDPRYGDYLKFLVNEAGSSKPFTGYANLKRVLQSTPTPESRSCIAEISKYFGEVVGPISIAEDSSIQDQTGDFDSASSVEVPSSTSQSGYDFKIGGTEVTVKMPKGKTNTLKPGDIVRNPDLKVRKRFFDLIKSKNGNFMLLYELFEILEEEKAQNGAYTVIYGTDGSNGILSNDLVGKKSEQDSVLIPGNGGEIPENIKSMYANALEKQIELWSKSNGIKSDMLEFTNLYYNTKRLFAFSYDIKSNTGRGIPKFKSVVRDAYIMGKYRAGPFGCDARGNMTTNPTAVQPEKLGIQMTF